MAYVLYISVTLTVVYALLMLLYKYGWKQQVPSTLNNGYIPSTSVSVIIPARNEELNIVDCVRSVLNQDYPEHLLEVIVVDDHSTDNTAAVVQGIADNRVKLLRLAEYIDEHQVAAHKKQALATGITHSSGQLIVTTDADCTAGKNWLKNIAALYEQDKPVMIVAPVDFTANGKLSGLFQSLDFMSMQGITVATLQLRLGNMSNGANLAFSRSAFDKVDGYKGVDHIASGDDYLLMMKLTKKIPGRVAYVKSKEAIVHTSPQPDWKSFLNQRVRWASKSGKYDDNRLTAVLLVVYLYNLSLLLTLVACLFDSSLWQYLLSMVIIKTVFELIYLLPVASFFNKRKQLWLFPLLQPLHIIYIVLAGFLGFVGVYQWKGRVVK